jgi:hypothetical protein
MARDMALIEPDPLDCGGWVEYLLEQIEAETKSKGKRADFYQTLKYLCLETSLQIILR